MYGTRRRKIKAGVACVGRVSSEDDGLIEHVGRVSKAICQMADGEKDMGVSEDEVHEIVRTELFQTNNALGR